MINNKGQSLLEVILAIALFGFICSALVSMSLGGFSSLRQGGEYVQAEALATQGIEAVRAIRDSAWNKIIYANSAVTSTGNVWQFVGENTSSTVGKFTRIINFASVCRDVSNNITACPGSYTDLNSKQATVTVNWLSEHNAVNTIQKVTYLTNWESREWTQTNWSGGDGQAIWSDVTKYDSEDGNLDDATAGEIKLKSSINSCGVKNWSFDNAGDYVYDSAKIEVTGGVAQLKNSGGSPIDGNTKGIWHLDEASGDIIDFSGNNNNLTNVIGSPLYGQTGKFSTSLQFNGNSSRYINNGQQISLGITGPITIDAWIYRTMAASAVEGIITKWRETGHKRSYALAVNAINHLAFYLSSDAQNETILTASSTIPLNQWVHVAGVYDGTNMRVFQNGALEGILSYGGGIADQAAFVGVSGANQLNGGNAFFNGKIDEARVSNAARWVTGFTPPTGAYGSFVYPADNPTINPINAHTVSGIDTWSGFSEIATKNGGEVYYQLSDNGGSTWKYWSGSAWAMAGSSNYNTATIVNTNIGTFTTSTSQIMFKAFLAGNGSQQVILDNVQVSCEKQYDWTFANAPDYTYNPSKIVITGGTASLADQGGGGFCSGTATVCNSFGSSPTCLAQTGCAWGGGVYGSSTNPDFGSTLNPWTTGSWGNTNPTMSRATSGGNPSGAYAKIQFPSTKNKLSGGYFQQPFVVSVAGSTATLNLDWIVSQYTGIADSLHLYAFVDTVVGTPTIGGAGQVWDSGNRTTISSWVTMSNINISSKIATAGTYYLKIAAYVDYSGTTRQYAVGFDNVLLNWSKPNFCSGTPTACNTFSNQTFCQAQGGCSWTGTATYPTDKPTINPAVVYGGNNINAWSGFNEIATKNGGEIYYQLSSDGSVWQYWNGGSWASAGVSDYNSASIINTNISAFTTSTEQIMFKAFFQSNGNQQVILDNVRVGWGENFGGGYATDGNFISSAFNMSDVSPVQILAWDQNTGGCGSCNIQLQLRTAPNSGGSPGAWTSWYGASGIGTYYINHSGTLLPTALNGNQWVQYRAELSGDGASTPILQEVRVNYK